MKVYLQFHKGLQHINNSLAWIWDSIVIELGQKKVLLKKCSDCWGLTIKQLLHCVAAVAGLLRII